MRPEEVTLGRLEREAGERAEQVAVEDTGRTVAEAELSVDERRQRGIEDNTRHNSSMGRR